MKSSRIQIAGKKSLLLLNGAPVGRSPLVWERMILELIALHAPLPSILNTLCTAVDIQIGGIVSLVLLSNEKEQDFHAIALRANDFGLHTFCSAALFSASNDLLGTLEILCCDPRSPTANEVQIIDRVTQLASIAIHGQPRDLLN